MFHFEIVICCLLLLLTNLETADVNHDHKKKNLLLNAILSVN